MSALEKLSKQVNSHDLHMNPNCQIFVDRFPVIETNVGDTHHTSWNNSKKGLISHIRADGDQQKRKTNVKAYMTGWFMHNYSSEFAWVCDHAMKIAEKHNPTPIKLEVFDCWGAVYNKGDWTKVHNHWPTVWSFVYYVKACEKCAPLVFDDCPIQDPWYAPLSTQAYCVIPKEGRMIMFPGWVRHSVPEQICDHERIVVSGNLITNIWT